MGEEKAVLDISEVSKLSGLPASTLRYYDGKGLITSVGRRGMRRLFEADVLERLSLIALGRMAGLSLDEIGAMFSPGGELCIDRAFLSGKADALDQQIKLLEAMRDGLRHAAECPAPSHLECPSFQRLFRFSGRKAARGTELR